MKIQISVLLAVYNGEMYLKESIDSILCQTFQNFELIIINDGSTDSTAEIIRQYQDSRIICIDNRVNKGLVDSLNTGLHLSHGKYIARMDGDDIALPHRLEVQFNFMELHPEIGICGSSVDAFYVHNGKHQTVKFATHDSEIRAFTFFQSPFCHPSVMIRKEILDRHNLQYSNEYYRAEDYALWIELLKYTQGANIPSVLLHYRKHEGSETALADKKMKERIRIVSNVHQQYLTQNRITLSPSELEIYTCFTDRSLPYIISRNNEKLVEEVLKNFLSQVYVKQNNLQKLVWSNLAINTFYKLFIYKKLPRSILLQRLFFKGGFFYLKRILRIN